MKDLYSKLESYFQFEKSDSIYVTLFKSIILLVCGGYLGLVLRELNSSPPLYNWYHIMVFAACLLVYFYIERRRLKKERNFPVTILEHLINTEEMNILKGKLNRKTKLYDYIDNSIQSLNSNTCPLTSEDNDLCSQDLKSGLHSVLEDIVERPQNILNVDQSEFMVGIFVNELLDKAPSSDDTLKVTAIFRDELSLSGYIQEALSDSEVDDIVVYQLQTILNEGLKFQKFISRQIVIKDETYTLICSPIPNVCENCPPDGIIYLMYRGTELCSNDCDSVTLIFGRILSNWISKYNDCVRHEKKQKLSSAHIHKSLKVPERLKGTDVTSVVPKND